MGPHTDVFAWGSVVAFAATGRPPFAGRTVAEVLNRVVNAAPDLDGLPERLRGPVTAALNKNPARRPSSQDLLMELLGRRTAPPAAPSAAGPPAPRSRSPGRPHPPGRPRPSRPPSGAGPRSPPCWPCSPPRRPAPSSWPAASAATEPARRGGRPPRAPRRRHRTRSPPRPRRRPRRSPPASRCRSPSSPPTTRRTGRARSTGCCGRSRSTRATAPPPWRTRTMTTASTSSPWSRGAPTRPKG
ncbi:hypothetical protein ACFQXA_28775 [Nocardiopsis composta]